MNKNNAELCVVMYEKNLPVIKEMIMDCVKAINEAVNKNQTNTYVIVNNQCDHVEKGKRFNDLVCEAVVSFLKNRYGYIASWEYTGENISFYIKLDLSDLVIA